MHTEAKTEKRTFQCQGVTVEVPITFKNYGSSWYANQAQVAKIIKAFAKSQWYTVLSCKSESYSGGDSVDITLETELTKEQLEQNEEMRKESFNKLFFEWHKEPRALFMKQVCGHFQTGSFDGMNDMYENKENGIYTEGPDGKPVRISSKYIFEHFMTREEFEGRNT